MDTFPLCWNTFFVAKKKTGVELEFSILDDGFTKSIKDMNTALIDMLWGREFKIPLPDFATGGILLNSSEEEKSIYYILNLIFHCLKSSKSTKRPVFVQLDTIFRKNNAKFAIEIIK